MRNRENLLAEAPTGSGKTAAALHPALAEGLATGRQVVFLTSKTLQQKMAVSALVGHERARVPHASRSAPRTGCAPTTASSATRSSAASPRGTRRRWSAPNLLGTLRDSYSHLDPDIVFEEARREEVCPFEVQLELAAASRRDRGRLQLRLRAGRGAAPPDGRGPARGDPPRSTRPTTCRTARGRSSRRRSSKRSWRTCATGWLLQPGELFADILASVEALEGIVATCADDLPEGEAIAEIEPPRDAILELRTDWESSLMRYLAWKRETRLALVDDPVLDFHFTLQRFAAVLSIFGPDFTARRRAPIARAGASALVCLDPARALAPIFGRPLRPCCSPRR